MISIRPSVENDIEAICSVDLIAQRENEQINGGSLFGVSSLRANASSPNGAKKLSVTAYSTILYHTGFIEMIYIHFDYRRSGAALVQHIESLCQTPKLFTSTNLSNLLMQSLPAKLGYVLIHNPDKDRRLFISNGFADGIRNIAE
jgi:hypothetical protein